jgi:hypothetical protein
MTENVALFKLVDTASLHLSVCLPVHSLYGQCGLAMAQESLTHSQCDRPPAHISIAGQRVECITWALQLMTPVIVVAFEHNSKGYCTLIRRNVQPESPWCFCTKTFVDEPERLVDLDMLGEGENRQMARILRFVADALAGDWF